MSSRRELSAVLGGIFLVLTSGCSYYNDSNDAGGDDSDTGIEGSSLEHFSYIEARVYDDDPDRSTVIESADEKLKESIVFREVLETVKREYPDEMEEARGVYHNQKYRIGEYDLDEYSDSEIETAVRTVRELPRSDPDKFPSGVYVEHDAYIMHIVPIIED